MKDEIWKFIESFESARASYVQDDSNLYIISNYGRYANVRRKPDIFTGDNRRVARLMHLNPSNAQGHYTSGLTSHGRRHRIGTHRIVMQFFGQPWPGKSFEINHKDGNPWNNYVANLEWVKHSSNIKYGFEALNRYRPSKEKTFHGRHRSKEQLELVRRLYKENVLTQKELAILCAVSQPTIKKWLDIKIVKQKKTKYTKNQPKDPGYIFPDLPNSIYVDGEEIVLVR